MRVAALTAMFLLLASAAQAEMGRDDQWRYVPAQGGRGAMAELVDDRRPPQLLFRIVCEPGSRTLSFRYFSDRPLDVYAPEVLNREMGLYLDEGGVSMEARRSGVSEITASLPLTSVLVAEIDGAAWIRIDGPNDMEEPWHAGRAPALKRLARECAA